jgi:hypothetical protein
MPISSQLQTGITQGENDRDQRVSDKVERAAEQASEATLARVEAVRDRAQDSMEQTRDRTAERIRRVGGLLRTATDELREEDADLARYTDMAIDRVDQVADYVGEASLRTIAEDLKELARTQPIPFFGGAFLLGFSVGRFLKNAVDGESESTPRDPPNEGRSAMRTRVGQDQGTPASGPRDESAYPARDPGAL